MLFLNEKAAARGSHWFTLLLFYVIKERKNVTSLPELAKHYGQYKSLEVICVFARILQDFNPLRISKILSNIFI
jgi:hypothetical protein